MKPRHLVHGFTEQHWKSCHKATPAATPPQDPNDMEDPQVGEILPPMLYDLFWNEAISFNGELKVLHFKAGMECVYKALKPLMQSALPHYEAGLCDTRTGQADAGKLAELERYKEIAEYVK